MFVFFKRYDYLRITNERNVTFGKYCGVRTGLTVSVTGRYAVITFHSDGSQRKRGYKLIFTYINSGKCHSIEMTKGSGVRTPLPTVTWVRLTRFMWVELIFNYRLSSKAFSPGYLAPTPQPLNQQ